MEFTVFLKGKADAAYRGHLLGEVWVGEVTDHPVWAAWAQTPGAVRPIAAAVWTGARFQTRISSNSIRWPTRDGPRLVHLSVCRDGVQDHVRTVAYFRDLCDPDPPHRREDGEVRFLIVPPTELTPFGGGELSRAAAAHVGIPLGDYPEFWTETWEAYAALLTLYLRSRTRSPILPGRMARSLLLATAVGNGLATWVASYDLNPPRRHIVPGARVSDLTGLGYSPPLYFTGTNEDVDRLCRVVPMIISRRYGREYLRGGIPPRFKEFQAADATALGLEIEAWLD